MADYCKKSLESLSDDAKQSIKVIERRVADSSTRDAIYGAVSAMPASPVSVRLTLYNIAKIVSIVRDDSVSGLVSEATRLMPEAIKSRKNPLAIETVFLFAGMVAEQSKNSQILKHYFEIVNGAGSDLGAKKLGENLIHTVIQAKNENKGAAETLMMMDEIGNWEKHSPFWEVRRNPPLLFSPSKAIVETFSIGKTMVEIGNSDVSKMLKKYENDSFSYRILAWNARRLNGALDSISERYIEERKSEEKARMRRIPVEGQSGEWQVVNFESLRGEWRVIKGGLLHAVCEAVTSYKLPNEAQNALWLIATIAKRTRSLKSISDSCDFVRGLAGNADELRTTSNFFVDALSYMGEMQHSSVGNSEIIRTVTDTLCEIKGPKKAETFAFQVAIAAERHNESRILELCGKIALPERRDSVQATSKSPTRQAC